MGIEIERKFLVKGEDWRFLATGQTYRQGYISTVRGIAVRVRIAGDRAYLTIKGKTQGMTRQEFEYPIPLNDAETMLDTLCDRPLIEKTRYAIQLGNFFWEIDEFFGDNQGLILAEIELIDENQEIDLPTWIDREVTDDPRYYNVNLVRHPYKDW